MHICRTMSGRVVGWILTALIASPGVASHAAEAEKAPAGVEARTAFGQLASLAGAWEGAAGEGKGRVEYRVASGGTVVMETLFPGTEYEMISMYHLDGEELMMTHYCAMGNQPRMRLDRAGSTATQLRFVFTGGTNLKPETDDHVHGGRIEIGSDGRLRAVWDFYSAGKQAGSNRFDVGRVGP